MLVIAPKKGKGVEAQLCITNQRSEELITHGYFPLLF